ncbi:MAG: hypothetical protein AAGI15_10165 [Pseudomonadota bacterium]
MRVSFTSPALLSLMLLSALSAGLPASAATSALDGFADTQIVSLTDAKVRAFIALSKEIEAMNLDLEDEMDADPGVDSWASAVEGNATVYSALKRHGFASGKDFALTSYAVMLAYGGLEMESNRAEIEQARAQLQAMKDQLPPETYALMEEQMLGAFALFEDQPQENLALVRKYREQLDALNE